MNGGRVGAWAVVLSAAACVLVMTVGNTRPERFSTYYSELADSILDGRFDVPPVVIGPEAFLVDGKTYGYFGPTPAILRMPLNALFPGRDGKWTRLVMASACLASLAGALALLRAARAAARVDDPGARTPGEGALEALFVVAAAAGTPLLYIVRSPVLYHEASAVAVAFATWTMVFVLRHRRCGGWAPLFAALVCATASFQARGSVGSGALLVLALQILATTWAALRAAPSARRPRLARALAFGVLAAACVGGVVAKNVIVSGNVSGIPPLSKHVQLINNPARLARTDGGVFVQPQNLKTSLVNYLDPRRVQVLDEYPWVRAMTADQVKRYPETKLDHVEGNAALTATSPFWCVLAVAGLFASALRRFRDFRFLVVGAAFGAYPMLIVACITQRFLHDAWPFLISAGAVAWAWALPQGGWTRGRAVGFAGLALLALFSCVVNTTVVLQMWRE